MPQESETRMPENVKVGVSMPGAMDVADFVRQVFIHGLPYEDAIRYDQSAVPVLLKMLSDPKEEPYWSNIALVLGMVGDDKVADPLVSFIEASKDGTLSRGHYVAKTSALWALGYLVNRTNNLKALDYLKAGASPETWAGKGAIGLAPFQANLIERNRDLAKHAIFGLAVSGHRDALPTLRSLLPTGTETAFQKKLADVVTEALAVHQQVASEGLETYYRKRQQRH
jgi:HEAT repeat protein